MNQAAMRVVDTILNDHAEAGRRESSSRTKLSSDEYKKLKSDLLFKMWEHGEELLREKPVIGVEDFESALGQQFKVEIKELQGKTKSGRMEWKNLTDWVKAKLTIQHKLSYLNFNAARYMVYLELRGSLNSGGPIVFKSDVNNLLRMIELRYQEYARPLEESKRSDSGLHFTRIEGKKYDDLVEWMGDNVDICQIIEDAKAEFPKLKLDDATILEAIAFEVKERI